MSSFLIVKLYIKVQENLYCLTVKPPTTYFFRTTIHNNSIFSPLTNLIKNTMLIWSLRVPKSNASSKESPQNNTLVREHFCVCFCRTIANFANKICHFCTICTISVVFTYNKAVISDPMKLFG